MANENTPHLSLSHRDQQMLRGGHGSVLQFAMELLGAVARCVGASRLIDISQAHLVGSYHGGAGDLAFLRRLAESGIRVAVPTTLNASSADVYQSRAGQVECEETEAACSIVRCYQEMGCRIELTCAPYHLPEVPRRGELIAWAESNAVVYANSVIGARTNKTFQYLDICAALTGRMPEYGYYLDGERRATILIHLDGIPQHWLANDACYPLLGHVLGLISGNEVPVIEGLPLSVTDDQLRALGASAASSGNVAMFHAVGLTPEAPTRDAALQSRLPDRVETVGAADVLGARTALCTTTSGPLSAICLGTPHYSLKEFLRLLSLLHGRQVCSDVEFFVSTSRHVFQQIRDRELLEILDFSGVTVVTDTCTYYGSLVKGREGVVMTSSGKWAYYAPGNLDVDVIFATLEDCLNSAIAGEIRVDESFWEV